MSFVDRSLASRRSGSRVPKIENDERTHTRVERDRDRSGELELY